MSEIVHNDSAIMNVFKDEVCKNLGKEAWDNLVEGIGIPDFNAEGNCGCHTMREFMKRFDSITDKPTAKHILTHVRHALTMDQFAWAKEDFAKHNNIDAFLEAGLDYHIKNFTKMRDSRETFYGQEITDDVLEFIFNKSGMLVAERKGSELYAYAFPSNMVEYLKATDDP